MEVERLAPIASSPLDYARGRGKHRRSTVLHIEFANTIDSVTSDNSTSSRDSGFGGLRRLKTRRNRRVPAPHLESLPTVGLHVQ